MMREPKYPGRPVECETRDTGNGVAMGNVVKAGTCVLWFRLTRDGMRGVRLASNMIVMHGDRRVEFSYDTER